MKQNIVNFKRSISKERKKQVSILKSQYEKSTMVVVNTMTVQEKVPACL